MFYEREIFQTRILILIGSIKKLNIVDFVMISAAHGVGTGSD